MKIEIKKLNQHDLDKNHVKEWPIWEKGISEFDWFYDNTEICFLLEGQVTVKTEAGETVSFGKGDLVTFPKGLSCQWSISEPVRKHYKFTD